MRHGKVVEEGPAADLFARPQSGYTRALFEAAFNLEATESLALEDAAPAPQKPEQHIKAAHDDLRNL